MLNQSPCSLGCSAQSRKKTPSSISIETGYRLLSTVSRISVRTLYAAYNAAMTCDPEHHSERDT